MAGIVLNHTAGEQNFTYTTDTCGNSDCPAARHPGDSKGRYVAAIHRLRARVPNLGPAEARDGRPI